MAQKIYVIEDDESIRELVKVALESYKYEVFAFDNAEEALDNIQKDAPDIAIFDIMLPQLDGISAVKLIKDDETTKHIPVMMLTAKDSEIDKVVGLDNGADDYMTKPFGILEFMARVRSLLRRKSVEQKLPKVSSDIMLANDVEININTREVKKQDEVIELTFKEYELFKYLMDNRDKVVSREEILEKIWGYDFDVETRTLDMHIRSLRQKIGDKGDTFIKTVRGVGYRFIANVSSK